MKNSLLFLALMMCYMAAEARHPSKVNNLMSRNTPDAEVLRDILAKQMQHNNAAMKGTGIEKRLKGHNYVENGILEDTTYYTYSNGRGSTHPVISSYYGYYSPSVLNSKQFVFCDTMYSRADYSGSGNLYENYYYYEYDSHNRVVYYVTGYSSFTYGYQLAYNSGNLLQTFTTIDLDATPIAPVSKIYFSYNSLGQRTTDSSADLKTNKPSSKREYLFDVSGNRVAYLAYQYKNNQMELYYKTTYTYDNNNRILTSISEIDNGTGMEFSSKDLFAYTGTANQYTHYSTYEWDNMNSEWVPEEMQTFTLNMAGMIDTYYIYTWNNSQWDTTEMDIYTYNNDLLVRTNGYIYTGSGNFSSIPYDQMDYYFEEYFPAGIASAEVSAGVVLYPNPATNVLHIKGKSINGNVSVNNINGQVIYKEQYKNVEDCRINISGFPSGNYILNIQDAQGPRIYQQLFTKQ